MKNLRFLTLSIFSGLLFAFSWPGIGDFSFLIFFALVPLLILENEISRETVFFKSNFKVFLYSYVGFFVFNLLTTWWIYKASLWGACAAIICNSLFMAVVFWLFHSTKRKVGEKPAYIGLIFYWIAFEYLHLNWELSWPWLTFGNVFANNPEWVQWYEYTGILGGSFWILSINILFFLGFRQIYFRSGKNLLKIVYPLAALVLFFSMSLWSDGMYKNYKIQGEDKEIVIIQPNIDPYYEKFWGMSESDQIDRLIALSHKKVTENTDFVVMPETAFPMAYWEHEFEYLYGTEQVRKLINDYPQLRVIVGLSTTKLYIQGDELSETAKPFPDGKGHYDNYNSAIQIDSSKKIPIHHKSRLVLGAETVPFLKYLPFMKRLSIDLGGTSGTLGYQEYPTVFHGSTKRAATVAPIICYESIYGEYVTEYIKQGANLLFVITNDGWWGNTPGYKQHFAYSRLRAIESRRGIARSANTGISGFINQRGDVLKKSDWWVQASLLGSLKSNNEITFYAEHGDYFGRISALVAILLLLFTIVKKLNKTEQRLNQNKQ